MTTKLFKKQKRKYFKETNENIILVRFSMT